MARDVLELCDELGLEDVALGGISMGAAVALHAALLAPARVRAMLLFAPPTAWETRGHGAGALPHAPRLRHA
jgi:pimeloyl-ACP methyl ester carboxylesterase